jgi:O-antigen ligase
VVLQAAAGSAASGTSSDPGRLAAVVAVVALAAPAWLAVRGALERRDARPPASAASRWVAAAVLVAAVLAGSAAFGSSAGRGAGAASGFLHGRADTWRAAVETFADRPLAGAGADAFLAGSARHQGGQTIVFAHDLPLELAAELGVMGLALAIALYLGTAHLIWRARRTRAAWLMGPAAATFLVASLVDWPWHLAGAGAVWALAVGTLTRIEPTSPVGWPPPGDAGRHRTTLQTQGES